MPWLHAHMAWSLVLPLHITLAPSSQQAACQLLWAQATQRASLLSQLGRWSSMVGTRVRQQRRPRLRNVLMFRQGLRSNFHCTSRHVRMTPASLLFLSPVPAHLDFCILYLLASSRQCSYVRVMKSCTILLRCVFLLHLLLVLLLFGGRNARWTST